MYETAGPAPKPAQPSLPAQPSQSSQSSQADLTELIARTASSDGPEPERYGKKRGGMSRTRKILLGLVGLAILGGVVSYIGWEQSNPPIQGTVLSYTSTSDGVQITFEVDKSSGMTATCVLAVEDYQGNVIGNATVQVPSGRSKSVQVYTVAVTGSGTASVNTALVQSCQAQ